MAEPRSEQVAETVRTVLAAIVADGGVTAHYTPTAVVRTSAFAADSLEPGHGNVDNPATLYIVLPGDEERTRAAAMGGVRFAEMTLDIVAAQQFFHANEKPYGQAVPNPSRWTIQNRLLHDIERALLVSDTLNGRGAGAVAINVEIPRRDRSPENTYVKGWAVGFLQAVVTYRYTEDQP